MCCSHYLNCCHYHSCDFMFLMTDVFSLQREAFRPPDSGELQSSGLLPVTPKLVVIYLFSALSLLQYYKLLSGRSHVFFFLTLHIVNPAPVFRI